MVDGLEERDYYQGKVARSTPEQEAWVQEHDAAAQDGIAPNRGPVEGVDTVKTRQATRDSSGEAVRR